MRQGFKYIKFLSSVEIEFYSSNKAKKFKVKYSLQSIAQSWIRCMSHNFGSRGHCFLQTRMDVNRKLEEDGKLLGISLGQKKNRQFIACGTQKGRRRGKGRLCKSSNSESVGFDTDLAVPAEQPSRARPFPASGMCPPAAGNQQSLNKARYIHETVGHTLQRWLFKGLRICSRSTLLQARSCTIFALRRVCVVLHGMWWCGLHVGRSLTKGSTSRFVLISVFNSF